MTPVYLGEWKQKEIEQLKKDFNITDETLKGCEIILAYYAYENYSGEAFVLLKKDGQLYEVNGSHCSCYGLEQNGSWSSDNNSQWELEETSVEALQKRLDANRFWGIDGYGDNITNLFRNELIEVMEKL